MQPLLHLIILTLFDLKVCSRFVCRSYLPNLRANALFFWCLEVRIIVDICKPSNVSPRLCSLFCQEYYYGHQAQQYMFSNVFSMTSTPKPHITLSEAFHRFCILRDWYWIPISLCHHSLDGKFATHLKVHTVVPHMSAP